jgi:hypothetical protein
MARWCVATTHDSRLFFLYPQVSNSVNLRKGIVVLFNLSHPTSNLKQVSFNLSCPCVALKKMFHPWGSMEAQALKKYEEEEELERSRKCLGETCEIKNLCQIKYFIDTEIYSTSNELC